MTCLKSVTVGYLGTKHFQIIVYLINDLRVVEWVAVIRFLFGMWHY